MRTFHEQPTSRMDDRLGFAVMGLGLVRLLQDAGRTEEARATLRLLEGPPKRQSPRRRSIRGRSSRAARVAAA